MVKATLDTTGFTVPDDEPEIKRSRKAHSNLEYFVFTTRLFQTTVSANWRDQLRDRYFETIDAVRVALETLFGESDFSLLRHLEIMMLNAINGRDTVIPSSSLSRHLDIWILILNWFIVCQHDNLRVYNTEQPMPVKRATRFSTV